MSKPEEQKVSRRKYLQIAGGTIAGLVVGGALGYVAKPTVTAPLEVVTSTVTGVAPPPPVTTAAAAKLTIADYTGDTSWPKFYNDMPTEYMKMHPELQMVVDRLPSTVFDTKVLTALSARTGAYDICHGTLDMEIGDYIAAGYVQTVDDYWTDQDKADFPPSILNTLTYKGHMMGWPTCTGVCFMFYRTDLFNDPKEKDGFKAKYGYDLTPPTSWGKEPDQFLDVAQWFTRGDMFGTCLPFKPHDHTAGEQFYNYCQQNGGTFLDENRKPVINSDQNVKTLQYLVDLVTKYKVTPSGVVTFSYTEMDELFAKGKIAFFHEWSYLYGVVPQITGQTIDHNYDIAPIAAGPVKFWVTPAMRYNFIPSDSKNIDAAAKYLQWLDRNKELTMAVSYDPEPSRLSVKDAAIAQQPAAKAYYDLLYDSYVKGGIYYVGPRIIAMTDIIEEEMSAAVSKMKTCKTALDDAQNRVSSLPGFG